MLATRAIAAYLLGPMVCALYIMLGIYCVLGFFLGAVPFAWLVVPLTSSYLPVDSSCQSTSAIYLKPTNKFSTTCALK